MMTALATASVKVSIDNNSIPIGPTTATAPPTSSSSPSAVERQAPTRAISSRSPCAEMQAERRLGAPGQSAASCLDRGHRRRPVGQFHRREQSPDRRRLRRQGHRDPVRRGIRAVPAICATSICSPAPSAPRASAPARISSQIEQATFTAAAGRRPRRLLEGGLRSQWRRPQSGEPQRGVAASSNGKLAVLAPLPNHEFEGSRSTSTAARFRSTCCPPSALEPVRQQLT